MEPKPDEPGAEHIPPTAEHDAHGAPAAGSAVSTTPDVDNAADAEKRALEFEKLRLEVADLRVAGRRSWITVLLGTVSTLLTALLSAVITYAVASGNLSLQRVQDVERRDQIYSAALHELGNKDTPSARAGAVIALGSYAVPSASRYDETTSILAARLADETDPAVLGILSQTLAKSGISTLPKVLRANESAMTTFVQASDAVAATQSVGVPDDDEVHRVPIAADAIVNLQTGESQVDPRRRPQWTSAMIAAVRTALRERSDFRGTNGDSRFGAQASKAPKDPGEVLRGSARTLMASSAALEGLIRSNASPGVDVPVHGATIIDADFSKLTIGSYDLSASTLIGTAFDADFRGAAASCAHFTLDGLWPNKYPHPAPVCPDQTLGRVSEDPLSPDHETNPIVTVRYHGSYGRIHAAHIKQRLFWLFDSHQSNSFASHAIGRLGGSCRYDSAKREFRIRTRNPVSELVMTVDRYVMATDGEERPVDAPPHLINGRLYIPVRVIFQFLGAAFTIEDRDFIRISGDDDAGGGKSCLTL